MAQLIRIQMKVLADSFIGVIREALGIADTLEECVQGKLRKAHVAYVFLIDQCSVQACELSGSLSDSSGIDGVLGNTVGCVRRFHKCLIL